MKPCFLVRLLLCNHYNTLTRVQAGRWYATGSVSCGTSDVESNGKKRADDHERRRLAMGNDKRAKSRLVDSRNSSTSKTAALPIDKEGGDGGNVGADNMTADRLGVEDDTASNDTAGTMMEDAISLQRDWAHVQWTAEELLPVWQVRREQEGSCHMSATAAAGGDGSAEATFALSAAVVAQVRVRHFGAAGGLRLCRAGRRRSRTITYLVCVCALCS